MFLIFGANRSGFRSLDATARTAARCTEISFSFTIETVLTMMSNVKPGSFVRATPTRRTDPVPPLGGEKPPGGAGTSTPSTKLAGIVPPKKHRFVKAVPPRSRTPHSEVQERLPSFSAPQDEPSVGSDEGSATIDNEASNSSESEQSTEKIQNASFEQDALLTNEQPSASGGQISTTPWQPKKTPRQRKLDALKKKRDEPQLQLKRDKARSMPRKLESNLEPASHSESTSNGTRLDYSLVPPTNSDRQGLPGRLKQTILDLIPSHRTKKPPLEILRDSDLYRDALKGDTHLLSLRPPVLESYLAALLKDDTAREMIETRDLAADEVVAFRWYGQDGFPYVQQSLRQKPDPFCGVEVAPRETFNNVIEACQRGFTKLRPLPPGTVLFRGTNFLFDENLQAGDVYREPAFVSTTTLKDVAADQKFQGRYLMKIINIPADERWRNISCFTGNPGESEVLGLPNTTFRVVSRENTGNQLDLDGETVYQEIVTIEPIGVN